MKTFADVKRRAQVGVTMALKYADGHPVLARKGNPPPRKIARAQTNAIAFEADEWSGSQMSWLYWPKASEVVIVDDDTFEIQGAYTGMRYRFLEAVT